MKLQGSMVAIVTPFADGKPDLRALKELVEWQIAEGTDGIIPCGTTGEGATLTAAERHDVIKAVVEAARGRVAVIAGAGSNATHEAIEGVKAAKELKADAALVVTPYYNKPTQEGIYKHYKMIAQSVDLPLVIYNIPGRTGSNIMPETMARLCEVRNIVAVKEASGSMDQVSDIRRLCGDRLTVLSGDDSLTLPLIALGAKGVISVITNMMPGEMRELVSAALDDNYARARELHYRMLPLMRALFVETNPIPIKHAMSLLKKCSAEVRMPLTPMSPTAADKLKAVMKEMKLL